MGNEFAVALLGAVVGGVFAIAGSIATTIFTESRAQVRADQVILFQLDDLVLSYYGIQHRRREGPTPDKVGSGSTDVLLKMYDLAWRLGSKKHSDIAAKILAFNNQETPEHLLDLKQEIQRAANPMLAKVLKTQSNALRRT